MTGDSAYNLARSYVKKTAEGLGAVKGKDGFSPIVMESSENSEENYQLEIITEKERFLTPNLLGERGQDGFTPEIGANDNWYINGHDTGKKAVGKDGINGITPSIDSQTQNWIIGEFDTGVVARGINGFSPNISIYKDTETEYILKITNQSGTYNTPNLKVIVSKTDESQIIKSYTDLTDKPKINGVEINGELSLGDLKINETLKEEGYVSKSDFPTYAETMSILNESEGAS